MKKIAIDNPFLGQKSYLFVDKASIITHRRKCPSTDCFFLLCLFGKVSARMNGTAGHFDVKPMKMDINVGITESDIGPLFINKGKQEFFIYMNGALRRIMDALNIADMTQFEGMKLPVIKSSRGFWIISAEGITCN